jgi:membrane associated rhomboid family serine protease
MLWVSVGAAIVYLLSMFDQSYVLYRILCFSKDKIFQGQIWRLFTYPLVYGVGEPNILLVAIGLFCYYSLGRAIENLWGTFRFNLFYFTGVVLIDLYCLIFNGYADAT